MKKILYLITDLNYGGTEKMLYETVTRLDKTVYTPVVAGLKGEGIYYRKLADAGIKVMALDIYKYGKIMSVFRIMHAIIKLASYIRRENIQLIHSYLFQANMIAKFTGFMTKRKVVTSIRVMEKQKKWQLFFERITDSMTEKIIVNSIALKQFVLDNRVTAEGKVAVIYNGIDINDLPAVNKQDKLKQLNINPGTDVIIGTVARLHKQKGMEYFIDAAAGVLQKKNNVKFIIVGDGPDRQKLENKVTDSNLQDKVYFTGYRNDSSELISVFDIFVLPSLWEGTPNVVLEAMGYGIPVISTDTGGVSEIITDNQNGLLAPPGNSAMLAGKILELLSNPQLLQKLSASGKQAVIDKFSMKKMITQTQLLYNPMLL